MQEGINMVYDGKKYMTKNLVYDKIMGQVGYAHNEEYISKRYCING